MAPQEIERRLLTFRTHMQRKAGRLARRVRLRAAGLTRDDIEQIGMLAAWRVLRRDAVCPDQHLDRAALTAVYHQLRKRRPLDSVDKGLVFEDTVGAAPRTSADERLTLLWLERARLRGPGSDLGLRPRANSTTGVRGVSLRKDGKYQAKATRNGRQIHLGRFDTLEEARAAVERHAAQNAGPDFRTALLSRLLSGSADSVNEVAESLAIEQGCSAETLRTRAVAVFEQLQAAAR